MERTWLVRGLLNTVEHGSTRLFDIATSLLLISLLSPSAFAQIAVAQAWVAPALLFFLSPDAALYRHYSAWCDEGRRSLAQRLRAFRVFAWGKGLVGLALAPLLATLLPVAGDFTTRCWALVWAFALVLTGQIAGPDREFLRLSMRLKTLNLLALAQKLILLGGVALATWLYPGSLPALAMAAILSLAVTAVLSWDRARACLRDLPTAPAAGAAKEPPTAWATLRHAILDFSLWSHLCGVIQNWAQTMELFFLGLFSFPARELGLFAVSLRLANASSALPLALGNLFSIWVGRRRVGEDPRRERRLLVLGSLGLLVILAIQNFLIWLLAPWLLDSLSRGRWTDAEQATMAAWLGVLLLGVGLFSLTLLLGAWLSLRRRMSRLFLRVFLPWGLGGGILTALLVHGGGLGAATWARLAASGLLALLLAAFTLSDDRRR